MLNEEQVLKVYTPPAFAFKPLPPSKTRPIKVPRETNVKRVLTYIRMNNGVSRKRLMKGCRITGVTLTSIIKVLLERGEIGEQYTRHSGAYPVNLYWPRK